MLCIFREPGSYLWVAAANTWPFILTGIYANSHIISDFSSVGGNTQRTGGVVTCLQLPASRQSPSQLWILMSLTLLVKRHFNWQRSCARSHRSVLTPLAWKEGSKSHISCSWVWLLMFYIMLRSNSKNRQKQHKVVFPRNVFFFYHSAYFFYHLSQYRFYQQEVTYYFAQPWSNIYLESYLCGPMWAGPVFTLH